MNKMEEVFYFSVRLWFEEGMPKETFNEDKFKIAHGYQDAIKLLGSDQPGKSGKEINSNTEQVIIAIISRAILDPAFQKTLTQNPEKALKKYSLSPKECKEIISSGLIPESSLVGDIYRKLMTSE